ncbi:MAG TPA: class I SAM-dependent rRNA methyltransferase [Gemmatales bacterium]|nr:class I SAM-dependent rRNA methyltransferase [Gemmatales bacterium]HMP57890.1 class I SAM-dependent rRNA methyltransferase [Gemmatales bacterium]
MATTAQVLLLPRRAKPFYARHPWVFAGAIASLDGDPADGDAVEVFSHGGAFIAHGLYNGRSRIRVRLYSWLHDQPIDDNFLKSRLDQALALRRDVLRLTGPQQACRLVFSESDGLSGLTVDAYDRWLILQFTSLALAQRRDRFVDLLRSLVQPEGIYLRTERGIGEQEGVELQDGLLWGALPEGPITIVEHGVRFLVNLREGQKTGYYLDQRDNHQAVAKYAPGRRVLDAFCYTGGFGLHCARAGAAEVVGIDGSEPALELARQNAAVNEFSQVSYERTDVFRWLEEAAKAKRKFDLIVLDPPKFARSSRAIDTALSGYRRLFALGMLLLEPGGILVICCCSGVITPAQLEEVLAQVATEAKRPVQLLERHGQPPDHPVSVACPETSYLKCLIARVL